MNILAMARLAALAVNNMGISFVRLRRKEQSCRALEDSLKMIMAIVRSNQESTSEWLLCSSLEAIMNKASSAIRDITENTFDSASESSSLQIITVDDISETVLKLSQDGCNTSVSTILIRMELEGTLLEACEKDDPSIDAAIILYNLASVYKSLALTEESIGTTTSTLQKKRLERALRLFELSLALIDFDSASKKFGKCNNGGLELLPFSILVLRGLITCTTMLASTQNEAKYTMKMSALQQEFLSHETLVKLLLGSSRGMAAAA